MAKNQKAETEAKDETTQFQLDQLEEQLKNLNIPDEVKQKILDNAQDAMSDGAREALVKNVTALVKHDRHADARKLLGGQRLSISVTFNKDGTVEGVTDRLTRPARMRKNGKSRTSTKGRKYEVNGNTYNTAAEAARENGVEFKGDSAVRVLKRALDAGQIKSFNIIESDDSSSAEEKEEAEATA